MGNFCDVLGHPAKIKVVRISSEGSGTVERCWNRIGTDGVYRCIDSKQIGMIFGLTLPLSDGVIVIAGTESESLVQSHRWETLSDEHPLEHPNSWTPSEGS